MSDYTEGQALVYVPNKSHGRFDPKPVVVTKVGRKWVSYTTDGKRSEGRFDRNTGFVDGGGYSSPGRIYRTMAEYQEKLDLDAALHELSDRLNWPRKASLSKELTAQRVRLAMGLLLMGGDTDPLEAILALVRQLPSGLSLRTYHARVELMAVRRLLGLDP